MFLCGSFSGTSFPEVTPPAIGSENPQSEHRIDVLGVPAGTGDLQPLLWDVRTGSDQAKWGLVIIPGLTFLTAEAQRSQRKNQRWNAFSASSASLQWIRKRGIMTNPQLNAQLTRILLANEVV